MEQPVFKKNAGALLLLRVSLIFTAVLGIFWPALHGSWLMDDKLYLSSSLMRDPDRLWNAWFQPGSFVEYYPLEESAQWMQWQLWRYDTFGYHLTNVILHFASALLVWKLLGKFNLRWAWWGGLLFAVHPANVESVAWISEFKNTLSLPPFLLAMCFYLDYEKSGRRRFYFLALGFFLVAMLCKVSMALFPLAMLLYIGWKRGRIGWSDCRAVAPFALLSLLLGSLTLLCGIWYQQNEIGTLDAIPIGGVFSRVALAGLTLSFYLVKAVFPVEPMFIYPQWKIDPPTPAQFLPWLFFIGVLIGFWTKRRTWGRHALLGFGFFAINLAPFLGLNVSTYMRFTWVMDHFLYIPLIGIIGLVIAGWEYLDEAIFPKRWMGIAGLAAVLALLACESHAYAKVFRDQKTLWIHVIRHNPRAWIAYSNLGLVLAQEGRGADAIAQYQKAEAIDPALVGPHINSGNTFQKLGRFQDAIAEYRQALAIRPDEPEAQNNWGNALVALNRPEEAGVHYREALRLAPGYAEARLGLGEALIQAGHVDEGIEQYREGLSFHPRNAALHLGLGIALAESGRMPKAISEFQEAVRLDPDDPQALNDLGVALDKSGRGSEAMEAFARARQLQGAAPK